MAVLTEGNRMNDVLKFESGVEKYLSREKVTVASGEALSVGTVLGKVTRSCPSTGTAGANTGAGTCTGVSMGPLAQIGTYTLRCIAAASGAGTFEVQAPDGTTLEQATVGVAYTNPHINFTLNDVGTDFAVGDTFTIAVSAGSGKVKAIDFSAEDGTEDAYGILLSQEVDTTGTLKSIAFTSGGTYEIRPGDQITGATGGATARVVSLTVSSGTWAGGDAAGTLILDDQVGTFESENLNVGDETNVATIGGNTSAYYPDLQGVALVRDAVIDADNLVWPSGATDTQKSAALAQLEAKGIVSRDAV